MEAVPDKDKLVVSIRASVVEDEGNEVDGVELDVSDNGPGFTDQILEHAFEPYVTTKSSGTGLGLATIKKIAEEHGAMVAAENRKDADGRVCGAKAYLCISPPLARTKPTELISFGKMKRIVLLQIEKHGSNFGC